ncbi:MAG: sensor histidine kinase [Algoriphagus sp.]
MSKSNITLIIVLMSLASFGLMGFQYYWIRNAIRINKERFDQNALQALSGTIAELEKGETSDVLLNKLIKDPELKESIFKKIDPIELQINTNRTYTRPSLVDTLVLSPVPQVSSTFRRMLLSRGMDVTILSELENFFAYMTPEVASSIFTPDEMQILLQEKERQLEYLNQKQRFAREQPRPYTGIVPQFDTEVNLSDDALDKIRKTNIKIELMNQAFSELSEGQQAIMDRLDTAQLRRLLKRQLVEKGITEDFELGIKQGKGELIGVGQLLDPQILLQEGLQSKLFPNDILGNDNFLYVYFPEKTSHVFRQVWLPISSSILFILVIIFCFYYAIRIILKQKALSDIKNDFINNMTHEFKTPLATVSLAVEALQDPELSNQDTFRNRYLGIIREENKRLVTQVEKVLQAAALDRNEFNLKLESIHLPAMLQACMDQFALQVENRGGKIEFISEMKDPYIVGDVFHLTHLFNNLLDNANKYSPSNPNIRVAVKEQGPEVQINLQDQGIGMSRDAAKKIFDKFYRVPTGNVHDVKGFGLGLSYVKTMLEAHHGTIQVQSELGKGSTFTINLPKKQ